MEAQVIQLEAIDWSFIFGFFIIALGIGFYVSKSAGKSESDFFLGGRSMPWWLLGFSMVATTFSTDTPNLVTNIVRKDGVAGNWVWWAFLLTGMLTVFVYARLWRRSGVTTDVEFYKIRYSGKEGDFLRTFRAGYLGILFNIVVMGGVSLAAAKIGNVMFGFSKLQTLSVAMVVTVIFSALGGFKGVLLTDFLLFIMAMVGSFAAAYFALGHADVGGLSGMLEKFSTTEALAGKLDIVPDFGSALFYGIFIIPLAVQWWSIYYPGAEPGGGGYLVQRMLAAKDEKNAVGATLFFNFAHYALRPWPWIIVALASLVVFPELADIKAAFPNAAAADIGHDSAYPAMLAKTVPAGWLGLIVASLVAAFMSTISTHLNWGSSYIVHDLLPKWKKDATAKDKVWVGRVATVILMLGTAFFTFFLEDAKDVFNLILQIGAGTGLLFVLRWFWWRINATCEIVAMVVSFVVALLLHTESISNIVEYLVLVAWNGFAEAGRVAMVMGNYAQEVLSLETIHKEAIAPLIKAKAALAEGAAVPAQIADQLAVAAKELSSAKALLDTPVVLKAKAVVQEASHLVGPAKMLIGVSITTFAWLVTAFITKPTDTKTLREFCRLINPAGWGWKKVFAEAEADGEKIESVSAQENLPFGILMMLLGSAAVYTALFATGYWIYGHTTPAIISTVICVAASVTVAVLWSKVVADRPEAEAATATDAPAATEEAKDETK